MTAETSEASPLDYRLHLDVVWVRCDDGSSRLLQLDGDACALDATSTEVLETVLAEGTPAAVGGLVAMYEAAPLAAKENVDGFVQQLRRQRLVEPTSPSRRLTGAELRARAATVVLPAALRAAAIRASDLRALARRHIALARIAVAAFGWARTVERWERRFPPPGTPASNANHLVPADRAVRDAAARSLLWPECKERALAALAVARTAGLPAELVVGATLMPLRLHVWAAVGDRVVGDDPAYCAAFEPIVRYTGGGRARPASPAVLSHGATDRMVTAR